MYFEHKAPIFSPFLVLQKISQIAIPESHKLVSEILDTFKISTNIVMVIRGNLSQDYRPFENIVDICEKHKRELIVESKVKPKEDLNDNQVPLEDA